MLDRIDDERARLFAPGLAGGLADLVSTGVLAENPVDGTYRMHSLLRAELLDDSPPSGRTSRFADLYLEAAQVLERVGETHEACLARAPPDTSLMITHPSTPSCFTPPHHDPSTPETW